MYKELTLVLDPEVALDEENLKSFLGKKLNLAETEFFHRVRRQSVDARKKQVKINLQVEVSSSPLPLNIDFEKKYQNVSQAKQAIVIGAGPAGLFAALRLIELGIKPIVLERGKDVQARRRDLAAINKDHIVNPDSNYCFGEGGAGTYSDGKLYTRSKKRGDIKRTLEILVAHGATEQILVDAHPHIGTNKLPKVVSELRESILGAGGEIHFDTKVTDFLLTNKELTGVLTENDDTYQGVGVILATGHSARDIYELLHKKGILIENKSFAMGVRIEHPQGFVDSCQYHKEERGILPAASYSLVSQTHYKGIKRGVFSFCMCPGGFIVPASTAPGELVVNGMSPSRRDSFFANSGVVVTINEPDWKAFEQHGPLAALEFQKSVEKKAWEVAVANSDTHEKDCQLAPAQLIPDFLNGRVSKKLNESSYQPGLVSVDMNKVLPPNIAEPLKEGIIAFGKKMRGYNSNQGQLIGIESRTSSPVRIPRDRETLEHLSTKRLFPCGEGAGYAGGIISAAMDGERCAEALVKIYK
ncbi:FAD-dependent protein [uncultured Arcticibacterium sp.]|uniref:NAD(P)/FAD-dependent oxidoreductase n=1 Tax=uncultured Arcticibacterium sp. TaxID=2173042 RepID=UPI0030FB173A